MTSLSEQEQLDRVWIVSVCREALDALHNHLGDDFLWSDLHRDYDFFDRSNLAEIETALAFYTGWHYRNVMFHDEAGDSLEEALAGFKKHIEDPVKKAIVYLNK